MSEMSRFVYDVQSRVAMLPEDLQSLIWLAVHPDVAVQRYLVALLYAIDRERFCEKHAIRKDTDVLYPWLSTNARSLRPVDMNDDAAPEWAQTSWE